MIQIFEYSNIRHTLTECDFDTNEYPNKYSYRKYSNIRIYSSHSDSGFQIVFSSFFSHFFLFVLSVKFVLGPIAFTATLKYGPNILIAQGTTKGGGGGRWTPY